MHIATAMVSSLVHFALPPSNNSNLSLFADLHFRPQGGDCQPTGRMKFVVWVDGIVSWWCFLNVVESYMEIWGTKVVSSECLSLWRHKLPVAPMVKNPLAKQETQLWSLGWDDSLEKEMPTHSSILQYSCLENSMDRGAWWATVHRVGKSRTWLSD